jgi:hypothetical protein
MRYIFFSLVYVVKCKYALFLTFVSGYVTNSLFCVLAGPLGVQVLRLCYGRVVGDAPLWLGHWKGFTLYHSEVSGVIYVGICNLSFYAISMDTTSLFADVSLLFLAILNL